MNKGVVYGIAAYGIWGLLPIYWRLLQHVPAAEILAHRMVWSLLFIAALLAYKRHWRWVWPALHQPRTVVTFVGTGLILAINWFTYIWAVNSGFIVETSLGYFINPLVNVLLGMVFLGERLRWSQGVAVALAVAGVAYLTVSYGAFPWIALTLAFSFAFYGLLRKTASLEASEGLALETAVLFLPALGYLVLLEANNTAAFANVNVSTTLLLIGAGIATGLPLLLFSAAARRVTLTNLGLLQYIAPTLQFLLGVFVYGEVFSRNRLVGFGLIWVALAVYSAEGIVRSRQGRRARRLQEVQNSSGA